MDAPSASPTAPALSPEEGIKCMYVENCDTGSQPRKAISHIFGRNKLCTRMIPQQVWVHFCRKHYQRSRYRNAQEYAKLQCELVQKQIKRVQAWSDENRRAGQAGVVQDWSLSVRKREQKRLDDRTSNRKRPFREESEDEEDADRAVLNGTAVPAWLLNKCNSGYSTAQIEEIVAQLKGEMDQGKLLQIPDIEILPNISTDSALDDGKPKTVMKRKTSSAAHKRSQSVGFTHSSRMDTAPMIRRISQPGFTGGWRPEDAMHSSPIEKRQRTAEFGAYGMGDRFGHMGGLPQVPERAVPTMRRMPHLPHRPAFSHIRENQTEETYFDDGARGSHYTFGGPLPAPTPQRLGQPMATQLETNTNNAPGYFEARRPMHQRAHSEMAGYNHSQGFSYRSAMQYPATAQSYPAEPLYEAQYMRAEPGMVGGGPPVGGPPGYYDEVPMARGYPPQQQQVWQAQAEAHQPPFAHPRHARHQSTSAVPQTVRQVHAAEHEAYGSPHRGPDPFEAQRHRQYSYAGVEAQQGQRMYEADQSKALYAERR